MRLDGVSSVVLFVEDWEAVAHWWARLTDRPLARFPRSASIQLGGVELVFSPHDERNPEGGSPLPYFCVADFDAVRAWLSSWGCLEIHRPLALPGARQITQFRDPFGNVFGIEGTLLGSATWPEVDAEVSALREIHDCL